VVVEPKINSENWKQFGHGNNYEQVELLLASKCWLGGGNTSKKRLWFSMKRLKKLFGRIGPITLLKKFKRLRAD